MLDQFAKEFGLDKVEGKQQVLGLKSGTEWEIDAKGFVQDGDKTVIVECRRYTKTRLNQESVGGLAYRICDTGAAGGMVVSPMGLQEGAEKVARAENIISVTLDAGSSSTEYVMRFLDQIHVGMAGELSLTGMLGIRVIRQDGTIEDVGCV